MTPPDFSFVFIGPWLMDIEKARIHAVAALERANSATEGPWESHTDDDRCGWLGNEGPGGPLTGHYGEFINAADATFIANARTDVPLLANNLLSALEELDGNFLAQKNKSLHERVQQLEVGNDERLDQYEAEIKRLEAMNIDLSAQLAEANKLPSFR